MRRCPTALAALLLWLPSGAFSAPLVTYEVEFDAVWSQATHPQDFPPNPHFSGLIGGTHDGGVVFWEPGGLATLGIERMAERGNKTRLRSEVEDAIATGDAEFVIDGGGISVSPGVRIETFQVTRDYTLVTLVSMVAPSPDWFVGVRGLALYDGGWLDEVAVDLFPYDAGTDSGVTFTSEDDDTDPQEPIAQITGFPFQGAPALGTFTFRRIPACSDGIDNEGDGLVDFDGGGVGAPDPTCNGDPERNREHARRCGLGFEAGVAVVLVTGVARPLLRRRRERSHRP